MVRAPLLLEGDVDKKTNTVCVTVSGHHCHLDDARLSMALATPFPFSVALNGANMAQLILPSDEDMHEGPRTAVYVTAIDFSRNFLTYFDWSSMKEKIEIAAMPPQHLVDDPNSPLDAMDDIHAIDASRVDAQRILRAGLSRGPLGVAIQSLILSSNSFTSLDGLRDADLPRLTKLHIGNNKLKNLPTFSLVDICPNLQELDIRNNCLSDLTSATIFCGGLTSLQHISFACNGNIDWGASTHITPDPSEETGDQRTARVTSALNDSLPSVPCWSALQSLSLFGCNLSGLERPVAQTSCSEKTLDDIRNVFRKYPRLRSVNVDGNFLPAVVGVALQNLMTP